jgi:hypothetical protein
MSSQPQSPGWPANAIPERWVEALFTAMSATYGARFADLWRGSKIEDVKRQWGVGLAKLSSLQMKAGRETMTDLERSPTLPEFIAHCRRARSEAAATETPQLEHTPKFTPEKAIENIKALDSMIARMRTRAEPNAEWAFRFMLRVESASEGMAFESIRCASDAVTSKAGEKVVDDCIDPDLRELYKSLRARVVDGYRMRGKPLWNTP